MAVSLKMMLKTIVGKEMQSPSQLADRFEVSVDLIEMMLDTLVQQGYLAIRSPEAACGGADSSAPCQHCAERIGCVRSSQQRIWFVTPKGIAYVLGRMA